jgi:hypothetical protein
MPSNNSTAAKPRIFKFANVEDAATGDSYEVFTFRKTFGRKGNLRIERDKARDSRAVLAALARKNAVLPHQEDEALKLVEQAIKSEPRRFRLHVRRLGWLPNRKGFALKRSVLRARIGDRQLRPPLWVNDRRVGVLKSSGTLVSPRLLHRGGPAQQSYQ